jgi:hypothetical protein
VGRARGGNAAGWCVRKDLRREGHCAKKTLEEEGERHTENTSEEEEGRSRAAGTSCALRQPLINYIFLLLF